MNMMMSIKVYHLYFILSLLVIIVGDSSVGKTNLIHSYSKEKIPTNTMPTVGV